MYDELVRCVYMCVLLWVWGKHQVQYYMTKCVCVLPILDRERQSDGQFPAGIGFQQHPPERTGGLNAFLVLTLSLTISFIPISPPYLPLSHFHFSIHTFLFVCSIHLLPKLHFLSCLLLLFLPPLCQCLCLSAFFFFISPLLIHLILAPFFLSFSTSIFRKEGCTE